MEIPCSNCQHQIHLDDSKVPEGVFKLKCPKCGKLLTAQRQVETPKPKTSAPDSPAEEISPAVQAYIKQEIAVAKSEMLNLFQAFLRNDSRDIMSHLEPGGVSIDKKALICHDDALVLEKIASTIKSMGYVVETSSVTAEVMKKLEVPGYHLVIVNHSLADDKEGGRKIVGRLNGQKTTHRRQAFVVLISPHIRSGDLNQAFLHSVNVALSDADLPNLEPMIRDGQRYFQQLYSTYYKVLEKSEEHIG